MSSPRAASAGASSSPSPEIAMSRIRAELQAQQLEQLVQKLTDKTFAKCVHRPGTSLSTSEQHCIAKAMDRYLEAMNLVFHTLNRKASSSSAQ